MQAMHHEAEKRVTPVFLCPQAESSGRHYSSSRFGNPDGRTEVFWGTECRFRFGAEPAIAPSQVLPQEGFVEATPDGKAVLYSLTPAVQRAKAGRAIALSCCLLSFD